MEELSPNLETGEDSQENTDGIDIRSWGGLYFAVCDEHGFSTLNGYASEAGARAAGEKFPCNHEKPLPEALSQLDPAPSDN